MLDLETAGKGPKAAIVAIGAVVFDPFTGELGSKFERVVSLNSSSYYGDMDASTVVWWMQQSEEARKIFAYDTPKTNLKTALLEFNDWLVAAKAGYKTAYVWGNGSGFDNVITRGAFDAVRVRPEFQFWADSDVRTMVRVGREVLGIDPKQTVKREGTHHNALDDAKFQAAYVSEIWQAIAAR